MADAAPVLPPRPSAVTTGWWLSAARLPLTTLIRMLAPLLATIAGGVGVNLVTAGVILALFELAGLSAPVAGVLVDRVGVRRALHGSLAVFAAAALGVAAAPHGVVLAVALVIAGLAGNVYEAAAVVWLAGITSFGSRAAVLGRYELSWAGGLLLGVPLAGVLSLASWRLAFAVLAIGAVIARGLLASRAGTAPVPVVALRATRRSVRPPGARRRAGATDEVSAAGRRHALAVFAGFGVLCGSSSLVLVASGVWLDQRHGLSTAAIGAVGFAFGVGDLVANLASVRFTDRIGKARGTVLGAVGLAACAGVLALDDGGLVAGVLLLVCCLVTFEFALLSCKPLLTELGWAQPGLGVGVGFAAAALCRAVAAVAATALYDARGLAGAAGAASAVALLAASIVAVGVREPERATSVSPGG